MVSARTLLRPKEEIEASGAEITNEKPPYDFPYEEIASAFTVAELGEMLPKGAKSMKSSSEDTSEGWFIYFAGQDRIFHAPTEADVRAKMLIYLLENNFISV